MELNETFLSGSMDYVLLQKLCFQEINYTSYARKLPRTGNHEFAKFIVKVIIILRIMLNIYLRFSNIF